MQLSRSQRKILNRLKTRGPSTAGALASQLEMTPVGARQHLAGLRQAELVDLSESPSPKGTRGRPVRTWHLTPAGHAQFADAHADMTVNLIVSVRELFGEQGLDRLIDDRTERTFAAYQQALGGKSGLHDQLKVLSEIRSAEGYMSEVKELGAESWLFIENHCPICAAATACQGFCRSELEVFQRLLAGRATIERINHIVAGARRCAYRVVAISPDDSTQLLAERL
jgi:predicted ArsR family transcriptional regulator